MTLIKSISGIRGTIGGIAGEGLSPMDVVKFVSAFTEILAGKENQKLKIVVGNLNSLLEDRLDWLTEIDC